MTRPLPVVPPPGTIFNVLFRHRRKMLLVFALVLGVAAAATLLTPRTYRSQAKLFLRLGRENVTLDPTATLGQTPVVAVPHSRENEVNSVIDLLKSQVLLEWVVARLGPDAILGRGPLETPAANSKHDARRSPWAGDPPGPGDDRYLATVQLARLLDVEAVKKSNVVRISCDGPSPEVAQAIVATLVELYLEQHVHLNRTPGAYAFLREQTAHLRDRLTASEEELRKLKSTTGVASPQEQRQVLVTRIGRLQDDLFQAEGAIAASEATTRTLRSRQASLPATQVSGVTRGLPNQAGDSLRAQLYTLQLKEKELTSRYPERHPEVRQIRKQVAAAAALVRREEAGREQVTTGPNRLHEEAQLALLREEPVLAALKARAAALGTQLAGQRRRLEQLERDQVRIARVQREVELLEAHYRKYADNLQQLRIDSALESEKMSNISVVQPATFDARAVRPRLAINLALGLLFALAAAVGVAVLCERLDSSWKSAR